MSDIFAVGDRYITSLAGLDPITATNWGIAGHDHRLTDYSPAGHAAATDLARLTLHEINQIVPATDGERIAIEVMRERLQSGIDLFDAGEFQRDISVLRSAHGSIRQAFDLMRLDTDDDWETARQRLAAVPAALRLARESLEMGLVSGRSAARRQAVACARQCVAWAADDGFFASFARRSPNVSLVSEAVAAAAAYLEYGEWLGDTYAGRTTAPDAVGAERYALRARGFSGADLDLHDTYAYGWSELHWIEARMAELADQILPGASVAEAIAHVEADPRYVIEGVDEFQQWNQQLIDTTIAALDGRHFDIADPIKRCEAMIAPPGGAAAMYYTGPSEDFSRPGRTWYPTMGKTRFPLWREVSICYHEGVPGHHLQIAQMRYQSQSLTRFQRLAGLTSGYAEGWALYAERLMQELGYFDDPVFELGWLSSQAMRAVRIVVDIGMHLQLRIPADERYHPGEAWTPELALPFVIERSCFPADFMASEVDRYLGLPGQAITYKVGERVWLQGRADLERRMGSRFDLKTFHRDALNMGGMGLDQLAAELARFADRV